MTHTAINNTRLLIRDLLSFIRWNYIEKINPIRAQKIFVVGLSKTGTTSVNDALNILGIESIHYPQFYHLFDGALRFNWHWRFEKARAFSDIPVVAFLDQLLVKYPNSYIIYTSRKKETWLKSCEKHFALASINATGEALRYKIYGSPVFVSDLYSLKYDRHSEFIKEKFKDHAQFLEIKLEDADKWGPLCKLLEIPVPNVDYPHSNKRQDGRAL